MTNSAAETVIGWFASLGCDERELKRARMFDIAGYVGFPFPNLNAAQTVCIGKYLSLWLLWDDVHVERLENHWNLDAQDILARRPPPNMTRFDEGWWQLFQDFTARRSSQWVQRTCQEMQIWSTAAVDEARLKLAYQRSGVLPSFARQLEVRIATIGMYGTICLLEDINDSEISDTLYHHPTSRRIQYLAGKIVGIGNEVLSVGKDVTKGQINLVTTLAHERGMTMEQAIAHLVEMHDDALAEYDRLAEELEAWAIGLQPRIGGWLQDLRYASLGFTLWEAQAPRYTDYKVVTGENRVIAPHVQLLAPSRSVSASC
jgi:hypothetical protein